MPMEVNKVETFVTYEGFRYKRTEFPNGMVQWECMSADQHIARNEAGCLERAYEGVSTANLIIKLINP